MNEVADELEGSGFHTGWFYSGFYTFILTKGEVTLDFQNRKTSVYTVLGEVADF
jgi:hypothetical protein